MTVFESAKVHVSTDLTIAEASEAFRNGVLSSVELVQACLKRSEEGKSLNVYVTLDSAGALQAAQAADTARKAGEPLKPLKIGRAHV